MTIEERAKEYSEQFIMSNSARENAYIQGATDQQKIDVDKACLEFSRFLDYLLESGRINLEERDDYEWCDKFRKSMEE